MNQSIAGKSTYIGLFMVTLATLMYEILLTRIFSVTMWYHFAFMAISIAMFGMTVGALAVYLLPAYFTESRTRLHLALTALLFSGSIVLSFLTHLSIPFIVSKSLVGLYSIGLTYTVLAIPFVFSGICVCLALIRFPGQISRLYAADLAGAAAGCILLVYTLRVTDGPTAVIVVACLAALGGLAFASDSAGKTMRVASVALTAALAFLALACTFTSHDTPSLLRLIWVRGDLEPRPLYERWNNFSRVTIAGDPDVNTPPFGWGLSPDYPAAPKLKQLNMFIDAGAGTIMTGFDGDTKKLDHLKYDIINLAHYVKSDSSVLVVGTGGGRDILSALVFDQKSVLGVEINQQIMNTVNGRFGDFSGHLDRDKRVTFVNDEARSYISRMKDKVDLIQISLVDTAAATAAGAFVLTENALYTVEGWTTFLEHLNPNGVLTVSRWYAVDTPAEIYRLTALASAALTKVGVQNPRGHIMLARVLPKEVLAGAEGIGTILVSRSPFSDRDVQTIGEVTQRMKFDLPLTPKAAADPNLADLASGINTEALTKKLRLNISAPTDDSPFFFNMLRLWDVFDYKLWEAGTRFNLKAVAVLFAILVVVIVLTSLCIVTPLALTADKSVLSGTASLFVFFIAIGFGFMFIEISQTQRLIVFLGHPTYGLSVVLFSLLISSGIGSFLTQNIQKNGLQSAGRLRLLFLLAILAGFGLLTPSTITAFRASETSIRILVALAILFPLGLFMGMAFPLGMKLGANRAAALTPWLWGINGATSVCASVIAVAISLSSGISASFWTGFACYAIAFLAFLLSTSSSPDVSTSEGQSTPAQAFQ